MAFSSITLHIIYFFVGTRSFTEPVSQPFGSAGWPARLLHIPVSGLQNEVQTQASKPGPT